MAITTSTFPVFRSPITFAASAAGQESRQHLHPHGEVTEALHEGGVVLLGKDRRRNQNGHLLARCYRLESGAHRDLGLPIADVAAHQPVHRYIALHVVFHFVDGTQLIGRLLIREALFELPLPRRVRRERVPLGAHPSE